MKTIAVSPWVAPFLLFGILTAYFAGGQIALQAHTDPGEMDTVAYLDAALRIKETGGVFKHVSNCLSGVYREATQHPLYLLLLSGFAEQNIGFFVRAKILTFWIGFLFLAVFFWCARRIFGEIEAILGSIFLLVSATFFHMTTMVACESLFALCFILFWYFTVKGFENNKLWFWAGLFAGLAFLSKSLGILTIPIFIISVAWSVGKNHSSRVACVSPPRKRCARGFGLTVFKKDNVPWRSASSRPSRNDSFRQTGHIIGFFIGFVLFTWPLFARNVKVYGTPFFSESSSVLWFNRWSDYLKTDIYTNPPTLWTYLKGHTPAQTLKVFLEGLFGRDVKMLVDGLKPFAFWHTIDLNSLQGFHQKTVGWQGPWAFMVFILFLMGLRRAVGRPEFTVTVFSLVIFLVFVGWFSKIFPGSPPTRLLYPILFLIWLFAARGIGGFFKSRRIFFPVAVFLAIYLISLNAHFDWSKSDVKRSYRFNPLVSLEIEWVRDRVRKGETALVSTLFANNAFYFRRGLAGNWLVWPTFVDFNELERYARDHAVKYAIIDISTAANNFELFREYFDIGPNVGLIPKKPLPNFFKPVPKEEGMPPLYEIYELKI